MSMDVKIMARKPSVGDLAEWSRYAVVCDYYGKFDDRSLVCNCNDRITADDLAGMLNEKTHGRPIDYHVERIYSFDEVPEDYLDETREERDEAFKDMLTNQKEQG